jgi:glycosyltransferase involved in cell wall biosynthesis
MLHRAITSVLAQTIQNIEIIVVDDASTQDVGGVVRSLNDARLVLVRHDATRGGSASRNTGILRARGEFVAFLDDDDEWLPEKLELQLQRMEADDRPGMVYTGAHHINQQSGCTVRMVQPHERPDLLRPLLMQNVIGTTSAIMVRRTCFCDGLMFDEQLRSCQDWDFYLKIAQRCPVRCISTPLVKYYMHDDRITRNYADVLQGHRAILSKVITKYSGTPAVIRYHHFKIGKLALLFDDKRTGRQELLRSLSFTPSEGVRVLYLLASFLRSDQYRKGSTFLQNLKTWFVHVRSLART